MRIKPLMVEHFLKINQKEMEQLNFKPVLRYLVPFKKGKNMGNFALNYLIKQDGSKEFTAIMLKMLMNRSSAEGYENFVC